ncbi:MAG: response regulator, partial [Anaerolineales bacterium]
MGNKQKSLGKILIADDETSLLEILGIILEEAGYEVLLADGGAKCIQLAQEKKPDLVLLDINMPDIGGERVLEEIKNRQIPTRVIMFTGYFRAIEDAIKFIKAGACDYLLKPVEVDEIQNAIQRALVLESTINLVSSNPTPLVNKLMAETEELQHRAAELSEQVHHLQIKDKWSNLLIRLIYLFAAS